MNDSDMKKDLKSFQSDADLKSATMALKESGQKIEHLNKDIMAVMDIGENKGKGFAAKALAKITPKSWYPKLPILVSKFIMEETDVLAMIESGQRKNIDDTQEALREMGKVTKEEKIALQKLKEDIERAEKENWSAKKLQAYMAEKSKIRIYQEISELLDEELNVLSEEEREARKQQLIIQLKGNVVIKEKLLETLRRASSAGLQVFYQAVNQYHDFTQVQRPMAVLRDSARDMTQTSKSLFIAKGALTATFKASLIAISNAVKAAEMVDKYAITSGDMALMFDTGRQALDQQLMEFQQKRNETLRQLTGPGKGAVDAEIVEDK